MITPHQAPSTQYRLVPELGPALGRLTALAGAPVAAPPAPRPEFADLRLILVGRIFELSAAARAALDADGAAEILAPERLRHEWERAATQASTRTLERIESRLQEASDRSGAPLRQRRRHAPTAEEGILIKARLLGAGVPFVDGLAALDMAEGSNEEWQAALLASARRLEGCWLALEQRALAEELAWESEAVLLAAWKPSPWPRRLTAGAIVIVLLYAGLVLGGFLPVPPGAQGIAKWWWSVDR